MNLTRQVKKVPNDIPNMTTINETAEKTGLAKHYIRQCCINNKIIHIRCGRRILINFDKFIEFLNTGDQMENIEPQKKIRKLG